MPARSFSAGTLRRPSVITSPARITCCRRRAAPASRPGSASSISGRAGPFHLHLAVKENRLVMEIRGAEDGAADGDGADPAETIMLPLAPFRRIVKDYFLVCESYYDAIRGKSLDQLEAIDVGRRALHDEGSTLLAERLAGKVALDHDTARRLFTLICVLHLRA